ncbi:p24 [Cryptophlebia peltastica nucleopolyhedrovirus]|uniref:p24 n=1 Tax=Cryptophlebia peltastica nucleopolyhedrovirus TaxID=2304025 RepID=A0A346RNX3_9ABAC|nr:p24 [Cryptophlebia peltastica nucleopolyhedrovirus]AXS67770.1 p24 [Cryptophlebia peltastica nucleopolyhedrovirus]
MYKNTPVHNSEATRFHYNDESIEVVIIENGEDDRDGYIELGAAADLLAHIVTIRGFNKAVLWANVIPSQRLTRNNKNYVHVFTLCKYLATLNLASSINTQQLSLIKRIVCDLMMGVQSQVVDPLSDIKSQICHIKDCLTNGAPKSDSPDSIYQPTVYDSSSSWTDSLRDLLRNEHNTLLSNFNLALENIKSLQIDLTNKLAYSNDTMLDNFKSLKDMIVRKK